MNHLIYCATNKINGKVYIGKNKGVALTRHWSHKKAALKEDSQWPFHRAIRKYGWDSFNWEIIAQCNDQNQANELEMYHIALTKDFHYNLTKGGEGSEGYRHSDDIRNLLSKKMTGSSNHRFGIKVSDETKRKMSDAKIGKVRSDHTKEILSIAKIGSLNPNAKAIVDQHGNAYQTITEAHKMTGLSRSTILKILKEKAPIKGYLFEMRG